MMREITSFSLGVFLLLLWGQVTPYSLPLQNDGLLQGIIGERMGIDIGSSFHKLSKRDVSTDLNIRQLWYKATGFYSRSTRAQKLKIFKKLVMTRDIMRREEQSDYGWWNRLFDLQVKDIQVITRELNLDATDLSISSEQFEILQNMRTFEGIQSSCDTDLFQCHYGMCINPDLVCDGSNDCLDDEDEENCTFVANEATTATESDIQHKTGNPQLIPNITECQDTTNFQCKNGTCIPFEWTCDGTADCLNSEDEQTCIDIIEICENKFTCDNGSCVPNSWRCDGELDCINGEDEQGCDLSQDSKSNESGTNNQDQGQINIDTICEEGFLCQPDHCIPIKWKCDGDLDCVNGEDEMDCNLDQNLKHIGSGNINDDQHVREENETENINDKTEKNTIKHLPTSF
eukprot:TRINITY_DN2288_c0_g1_i20.p1 TRINITY_DN2288_c0_g1~~TRINITY_DN2288_c0_g1_i20.p1  ORF type:complete len:402 (+),score=50.34 TRINITY_DN2288_c0_g1_i20:119-1324(+)